MRHDPVMDVQNAIGCGGGVVVDAGGDGAGEGGEAGRAVGDVAAIVDCCVGVAG